MKQTIKFRFDCFKKDNLGAIPILSKSVRGMNYGRQKVIDAFNKLVPKEEYLQSEKFEILNWLDSQNKSKELPEYPLKLTFQK